MGPGSGGLSDRKQIHLVSSNERIIDQLKKSWEIENCGLIDEGESIEDKRAKARMDETVTKTPEGKYQIGLPWKHSDTNLPPNKPLAEVRLSYLKKRLEKDEVMYKGYVDTMNSYLEMGYAEPVTEEGITRNVWYLPHHPVVHPHKPGKVRVVFDCAARWKGISLNDCLLKGPDFTNSLLGVLIRFRQEKVAIVADIQAMFHQVKVLPEDRDALRFLWWPNGELTKQAKTYKMSVHLFGATSSPSCARYALRRTAEDNIHENEDEVGRTAVTTVKENFYVDDCLTSVQDTAEAIKLVQRLRTLLSKGGFRLTKWLSNERTVLDSVPHDERAPSVSLSLDQLPTERALGICWDAESDEFTFEVAIKDKPTTRRGILSVTSSVYDPLGFAAPFIFVARTLLQAICRRGVNWDEALSDEEFRVWERWLKQVPSLSSLRIQRWLKREDAGTAQLHIFSDASEKEYAAVGYIRTVSESGDIRCKFVLGKTRVSPLRSVSIPRLELTAAVLAVTLNSIIRKEIRFEVDETTYWTDSTTVLQYIQNEDRRFKTFVANRLAKIHEVSKPSQWRYVNTKINPADEGSRGLEVITNESCWLKGPSFLLKEESCWPDTPFIALDMKEDPELKKRVLLQSVDTQIGIGTIIQRYSSWTKLIRGVGWLVRFMNVMRARTTGKKIERDYLSVSELRHSENVILKLVQTNEFPKYCEDKRLVKLSPVILDGLLRVGGWLDRAAIDRDEKHPIVLPSQGHVTRLLIMHHHEAVGHSGWGATLTHLREKYWLLKGRTAIKGVLGKCVACKRYQGRPARQVMAALPLERVTADKLPFSFVGVDYFGPFQIKQGRSLVKRYGCIFTCLSMRAVHLEIAKSLDTDSFINALRRFVCRRGQPEKFFSDNGTNFHGAEKELRDILQGINQGKIEQFLHTKGSEWHFNPPSASHMGGIWERLIRSVRRILNGLLAEQNVCEEVLVTVMSEVESILNSRPLTEISFDPRDGDPLTPNHLLLLRKGPDPPVGILEKADSFGKRRWRQAQYLASVFWQRWRKEYLPLLQKRHKWTTPKKNVMVDDIVILIGDATPRGKWLLGKVMCVYPGRDDKVRHVDVKVGNKILKRPVAKLCVISPAVDPVIAAQP